MARILQFPSLPVGQGRPLLESAMRQGLAAGGLDQAQVDDAISGLSTLIALMAEGPPGLTLTTAAGQQDHGERIALFLDKLWQRERQYISELLIKQIEVTELKRAMGLL